MKIILMRHGQAAPYCDDDAGRALTTFGERQARESAVHLLEAFKPTRIISSPYLRARQTAQALFEAMRDKPVMNVIEAITPDDDAVAGLYELDELLQGCDDEMVAVVCHMPIVAKMEAWLTGNDATPFELAEYRVVETPAISCGFGVNITQYSPKQPC